MKALVAIIVLVVVCIVLFITGVFSPEKNKRMQRKITGAAKRIENQADRRAGRFGDMTSAGVEKMRGADNTSARAGRSVHDKITKER